jgi:hypothetical protein
VIDSAWVKKLGLETSATGKAAGGASGADASFQVIQGAEIRSGGLALSRQTVLAMPFGYVAERMGVSTDGTLGSNLFLPYVVQLDYQNGRATVFPPESWNPEGQGEALPISVNDKVPVVQAVVQLPDGSSVSGGFLVDTGQIISGLLLSKPFLDAHPGAKKNAVHPPAVSAVGGTMEYEAARIPALFLGGEKIENPIAAFPEKAAGIYARPDIAGAIGADILSQFTVTFDYGRKQMFLLPNANRGKPFQFDRSGAALGVVPPHYEHIEIRGLMRGSPAAKAGLHPGDRLLSLDGRPVDNLLSAQEALRTGGRHRLVVERKGRKFPVSLRLQPLL